MDAASSSFSQHIDEHRAYYSAGISVGKNSSDDFHKIKLNPDVFISKCDLVNKFAHLKPKALGESALGGELFRACPHTFAGMYYPIALKVISNCFAPLQFVGGQVHELLKPKSSPMVSNSYRDITLCNSDCKPFMFSVRGKALPHFQSAVNHAQFGAGCNSGSTAMAHLGAR
eukprot:12402874-Karenia_brevis.AAC.1